MKIIFFGSSGFSVQALKACLDSPHSVAHVITTPDQKKGRGMKVFPTIIKTTASEAGLPVSAPENLKDALLREQIEALKPDLFVVSSYGKFIPSSWLKIPSIVPLNVHPSLIPKYRGASPVNAPILNGDRETGVTIMEVTKDMDAGQVYAQVSMPLDETMDAEKLEGVLAERSYPLLQEVLGQAAAGTLKGVPQKEEEATYAGKLKKEDGYVVWSDSAAAIARRIRGLKPWPGTYVTFEGEPLILNEGRAENSEGKARPGTLLEIAKDGSICVAAGEGVLRILSVKPSGKKIMPAAAFIHGRRLKTGALLAAL